MDGQGKNNNADEHRADVVSRSKTGGVEQCEADRDEGHERGEEVGHVVPGVRLERGGRNATPDAEFGGRQGDFDRDGCQQGVDGVRRQRGRDGKRGEAMPETRRAGQQ